LEGEEVNVSARRFITARACATSRAGRRIIRWAKAPPPLFFAAIWRDQRRSLTSSACLLLPALPQTQWIPRPRRDIAIGRRSVVNAPKPRDIEALCSAKGMRMTEQRRVIA